MSPTLGRWQVIVVEDADRVTERGADALLKSIEEPAPRTVWILCAPTPDDVVATIRSRCRQLKLQTPSVAAVAELLQTRDGIEPALAATRPGPPRATSAARGRWPATRTPDPPREVLRIPLQLRGLGGCLTAAAELVEACTKEAATATEEMDARERRALEEALGFGTRGAARQAQAAFKDLEDQQKARAKRFQHDAIDRALTELTGFYRDVLSVQTGSGAALVNADLAAQIASWQGNRPQSPRCAGSRRCSVAVPLGGKRGSAAGRGGDHDRSGGGLTRCRGESSLQFFVSGTFLPRSVLT